VLDRYSGPVQSLLGRYYGRIWYFRDISDRKQVEAKLRNSEANLLTAQQVAHVGNWEFEVTTGQVTASAELCRIFGLDAGTSKLTYLHIIQRIHPQDRGLIKTVIRQMSSTGDPYELECRIHQPDGSSRYIEARGKAVWNARRQIQTLFGTVLDITDRKQIELALEQAKDAAEAASRAKSAFLATMSHELRSPLNAILGFAQLLSVSPALSAEDRESIHLINHSGQHLLQLINDVLNMSKIEAGRMTLHPRQIDLHQLITDLETMFRLRACNKQLWLLCHCASDVPHMVYADDIKLRQVLINLLSNAIKFTRSGGVTLRVSCVSRQQIGELHTAMPSPDSLRFEVEDTGEGIAAEDIDSIFDAFVQASAGRALQKGTGLGLSISRAFIQLMGGDITVTSELNTGSIFVVTIPVQVVQPVDQQELSPSAIAPITPLSAAAMVEDSNPIQSPMAPFDLQSSLGRLSVEWRNSLHQATLEGDHELLLTLIAQIDAQDDILATQLMSLVNHFQYARLLSLTNTGLD
jgi:PAS domain S-box-containing protein